MSLILQTALKSTLIDLLSHSIDIFSPTNPNYIWSYRCCEELHGLHISDSDFITCNENYLNKVEGGPLDSASIHLMFQP